MHVLAASACSSKHLLCSVQQSGWKCLLSKTSHKMQQLQKTGTCDAAFRSAMLGTHQQATNRICSLSLEQQ